MSPKQSKPNKENALEQAISKAVGRTAGAKNGAKPAPKTAKNPPEKRKNAPAEKPVAKAPKPPKAAPKPETKGGKPQGKRAAGKTTVLDAVRSAADAVETAAEKAVQKSGKKGKKAAGKTEAPAGKLKIIPLGGLGEIGKNLTVYEYDRDIIVVDCGMGFPDEGMYGVDVVIPDVSYLEENAGRIRGIFLTHGHEDHIGAIPFVLRKLNPPIYATRLTAGLVKIKLEEHKLLRTTQLHTVEPGMTIKAGCFSVEFIHINHSISDSVAFAIRTPVGTVIHTGVF